MKQIERLIRDLLTPMSPEAPFVLGVFTTLWGLWIVSPFWQVFTSAPLFFRVHEFAPEWAWGTWSTTCGLLLGAAMRGDKRWLASFSLGFMTWHWLIIGTLFWWGDWRNTGGLTYTFIGLCALWCYLNYRINTIQRSPIHVDLKSKTRRIRIRIKR